LTTGKPSSARMKISAMLFLAFLAATSQASAGTLAQFHTQFGDIDVELYDQDKPVTVQNFIRYAQSGAWRDMFLHRCDPNFVVQGGGFYVANRSRTNPVIDRVVPFGTLVNEFGVGRQYSNVYGTIAMAKAPGDTNSASSQWFFNLKDNVFLDAPDTNNLFVVFGQVVGGTNVLNVFKSFSRTSPTNVIADFTSILGDAFGELPLLSTNATYNDLLYADVSLLTVQLRSASNGGREISWNSVSNKTNTVEFTTHFPPLWQSLTATNGTGETFKFVDSSATNAQRFYRVRVDY
jgi:cyclophilin family peptidyl-prolyl cis-trans isomerase